MTRSSARWTPALVTAFELASRSWMRRRLAALHLCGMPANLPIDRPLLLAANHTSWWDGFILRDIQRRLRPRAPLFTLMTGAQLERFPALRWMGGLDVGPHSLPALRSALRLLVAERVRTPDLVVAVFPQGQLWTVRRRPMEFRRGITTVARMLAPVTVLPIGIQYETFASAAPSAFVSIGAPMVVQRELDLGALEGAVGEELDAVSALLDRHGERAAAMWPGMTDRVARLALVTDA